MMDMDSVRRLVRLQFPAHVAAVAAVAAAAARGAGTVGARRHRYHHRQTTLTKGPQAGAAAPIDLQMAG